MDGCQHSLLLSGCLCLCLIVFRRTNYDKPIPRFILQFLIFTVNQWSVSALLCGERIKVKSVENSRNLAEEHFSTFSSRANIFVLLSKWLAGWRRGEETIEWTAGRQVVAVSFCCVRCLLLCAC